MSRSLVALLTLCPSVALACGGFFCSAEPVDQQAERIIFVQEDASTVSAYVEIQYVGDPEDFAWVVPVPALPELDVWHGLAFNALDLATQPRFDTPWACFADEDGAGGGPPADPGANRGEVEVLAQERVGPFDTATITSEDPRALVEWLRQNGYRIMPEMEPFIALYTAEGLKFLAMKLAPGEDTASIQPIKMTYAAAGPAVPLRLTAVAAQLEMGVKVWLLGEGRQGPLNVAELEIDAADLRLDPWTWQTNYPALVAKAADQGGGRGFVLERAQPTAALAQQVRDSFVPDRVGQPGIDARDALAALLDSKPYMTRLYTRLSPEEMDHDPIFGPAEGGDFEGVYEVPAPEGDECGGGFNEDADPCDFVACGAGGACVAVDGENDQRVAGCACAEGALARGQADSTQRSGVAVACGDARLNFAASTRDEVLDFADPCDTFDCGSRGECISLNGFPSCRCERGSAAVGRRVDNAILVECKEAEVAPEIYALPLPEPELPYPGRPAAPHTPVDEGPDDVTPVPQAPEAEPEPGVMRPEQRGMPTSMGSSDDDGCSSVPGAPSTAWPLLLLLAFRRRR